MRLLASRFLRWSSIALLALSSLIAIGEPVMWSLPELEKIPGMQPAPEVDPGDGLRAFYYAGLPLNGKPTRVFAIYGAPANASSEHKVPGIVLVHGGGGTAFAAWVKLWRDRGYAAIAMDNTGGLPIGKTGAWQRVQGGGPGFQGVVQVNLSVTDQWMYHAVADTVLAHSLLRSFPEVDADRTGITGISWGGVITCTAAGIDPRFKFAVPVYGCGFLSDPPGSGLANDGSCFVGENADPALRARWRELWDPANYLSRVRVPVLWVVGSNDFAFTLGAVRQSIETVPGGAMLSVHPRMIHSHGGPGEKPEEIHAFADRMVNGGPPLIRITDQGESPDGNVWVEYDSTGSSEPREAVLWTTHNQGLWQNRWWSDHPAKIDPVHHRVTARLPAGAACWYLSITDSRGLITSSIWHERATR
ncbi:MAG: acetylxylan esterase [Opitutaceae bacterium]|jgi:dienelactone hydrolase